MSNRFSALHALRLNITKHSNCPKPSVAPVIHPSYRTRASIIQMSANTSGIATPVEGGEENTTRKLKVLMLHGYTQSGPLFHAKTRALEKLLTKAFPPKPASPIFPTYPGGITLIYPTAPVRLVPADIPGFNTSELEGTDAETDAWGWWKRETGSAVYAGLEDGLKTIRETIESVGGVDGVVGFSQGGCAAAFVASLLEAGRQDNFAAYISKHPKAFPYPEGWGELQKMNGELKFAVSYSGFYAPDERYIPFYEPKIRTPFLSVIGSLDSVVEEVRSKGLVERTFGERVVWHPGGHFVPVGKEMAGVLVGFVRECCEVKKKEEESVEHIDVPF